MRSHADVYGAIINDHHSTVYHITSEGDRQLQDKRTQDFYQREEEKHLDLYQRLQRTVKQQIDAQIDFLFCKMKTEKFGFM